MRRPLVFISHATPEDNEFTLWLSSRLSLAGYSVWSDVTELLGGEKWWDDIDEAISKHTAKFILVITQTAIKKPGVIKELELALNAEKENNIERFIIPIIIDDTNFEGLPYDLSERNIISFQDGWGEGLSKLNKRLVKDNVLRTETIPNLSIELERILDTKYQLVSEGSVITSNQLCIISLPEKLNFYRVPIPEKDFEIYFPRANFPWFSWEGHIVTFEQRDLLQIRMKHGMYVNPSPSIDLSAAVTNSPRNHTKFLKEDLFNQINNLLNQSWNNYCQNFGLKKYNLSSNKVAWFFPDHEKYGGFIRFPNIHGEIKRKQVIGWSGKNDVFWHFAVEAKIQFGPNPKVLLIPHVVFTRDGINPLDDKNKMHSLRRGFCRNWWNDRWRDMLLTYLYLLSEGNESLKLLVSDNGVIEIGSRPIFFSCPVSLTCNELETESSEGVEDVEVDILELEDLSDD